MNKKLLNISLLVLLNFSLISCGETYYEITFQRVEVINNKITFTNKFIRNLKENTEICVFKFIDDGENVYGLENLLEEEEKIVPVEYKDKDFAIYHLVIFDNDAMINDSQIFGNFGYYDFSLIVKEDATIYFYSFFELVKREV